MLKIKDLEINNVTDITLVVKSATARETKAKKPYLALEFFDGTDTINGNYWDWAGINIPQKNAILDVHAQVTEWQGTKQLNVKSMKSNTEVTLDSFMPASGVDCTKVYSDAYELMSSITDDFLRELALNILESLQIKWLTVPGAKGVHHAYMAGTLIHSLSVARIAKAIAENTPGSSVDMCTVGGMLHDVGKLFTYEMEGITIDMSDVGRLYDHTFIGAEFVGNYAENLFNIDGIIEAKLEMLRHIILSHHGLLEHGAVVQPLSIDAVIVHNADYVDATAEQIRVASAKAGEAKWTDRIWTLNNKPCLSTEYVKNTMEWTIVD